MLAEQMTQPGFTQEQIDDLKAQGYTEEQIQELL